MPSKLGRYKVTAEFSLETRIEPDGVRFDGFGSDAEQFSDDSYFSDTEVEVYGGGVSFEVEAEDEDAAAEKSADVIYDGQEVEDDNGFTWMVTNLNVEVEELEAPEEEVSLSDAFALVHNVVARLQVNKQISAEEAAAFVVLINAVARVLADAPVEA